MQKVLTITVEEAQEILEAFDALEREFGGCSPFQERCDWSYDPLSTVCRICKRLREFLAPKGKEE
jgi:hypothetical protein